MLKMDWNEQEGCVVHGALAMVLRMSRYCGLAPLKFEKTIGGWYITVSPMTSYLSYIFAITLGILSLVGLVLDLSVENTRSVRVSSSMTAAVFIAEILLINVTVVMGTMGAPARMKQIINIKKSIAKIDLQSASYRMTSENKLAAGVLLFLAVAIFLLGSDYWSNINRALQYNKDRTVAYMYTPFFVQYAITFILQFQFVLVALEIQRSIKRMNDAFEDISLNMYSKAAKRDNNVMTTDISNKIIYEPLESVNMLVDSLSRGILKKRLSFIGTLYLSVQPHEAVSRLASLHCLLCDLVQQMNTTYGTILIALLLGFLLHLVMSPYYLILQLQDSQKKVYKLCLQLLWCIFHTCNMFGLVEPCHRTIIEFDRTQELVSRLMRRLQSNSSQMAVQLELFSRQLLLRTVYYSPLGMCKLGRPLITSIIGGVTTYLVILIQFQKFSDFNATGNV